MPHEKRLAHGAFRYVIIDFHTHAFPDGVAAKAIPALAAAGGIQPFLDGTLISLLRSMDEAGVDRSVICNIATRPSQFDSILQWCVEKASPRLEFFPSVHPGASQAREQVRMVHAAGFRGIKVHPYYQEFTLDEDRMMPLYEEMQRLDLILVSHTGFDIAYPRHPIASPRRVANVIRRFPALKFVATHLGGWADWDEVERWLLGWPVYIEISFASETLGPERMKRMLDAHPADHLLFGTDSPWARPYDELRRIRALRLCPDRERRLLGGNAAYLLGMTEGVQCV